MHYKDEPKQLHDCATIFMEPSLVRFNFTSFIILYTGYHESHKTKNVCSHSMQYSRSQTGTSGRNIARNRLSCVHVKSASPISLKPKLQV